MPEFDVDVAQLRWEFITVRIEAATQEDAAEIARLRHETGTLEADSQDWEVGDVEHLASEDFAPGLHWRPVSPSYDPKPAAARPLHRFEVVHDRPDPSGAACWVRGLFVCQAEDHGHAAEQCRNAHPGCRVVSAAGPAAVAAAPAPMGAA